MNRPTLPYRPLSLIFLTFCLAASLSSTAHAEATTRQLLPGDKLLNTSPLKAFTSHTSWGRRDVSFGKVEGQALLHVVQTVNTPAGPMVDHMVVDAKTLAVNFRFSPYFALGKDYLAMHVGGRQLSGSLIPLDGRPPRLLDEELEAPVFQEDLFDLMLASLPLEKGWGAAIPILTASLSKQTFSTSWVDLKVTGRETIKGGDGRKYDTWVVEAAYRGIDYRERHWIADVPPYGIQRSRHMPDGSERTSGFERVER